MAASCLLLSVTQVADLQGVAVLAEGESDGTAITVNRSDRNRTGPSEDRRRTWLGSESISRRLCPSQ